MKYDKVYPQDYSFTKEMENIPNNIINNIIISLIETAEQYNSFPVIYKRDNILFVIEDLKTHYGVTIAKDYCDTYLQK